MKYCTKCGTMLYDDDLFCSKCGKKFESPIENNPNNVETLDKKENEVDNKEPIKVDNNVIIEEVKQEETVVNKNTNNEITKEEKIEESIIEETKQEEINETPIVDDKKEQETIVNEVTKEEKIEESTIEDAKQEEIVLEEKTVNENNSKNPEINDVKEELNTNSGKKTKQRVAIHEQKVKDFLPVSLIIIGGSIILWIINKMIPHNFSVFADVFPFLLFLFMTIAYSVMSMIRAIKTLKRKIYFISVLSFVIFGLLVTCAIIDFIFLVNS